MSLQRFYGFVTEVIVFAEFVQSFCKVFALVSEQDPWQEQEDPVQEPEQYQEQELGP